MGLQGWPLSEVAELGIKAQKAGPRYKRSELACWLAVSRYPGLGPRKFEALLQKEGSLADCFSGDLPKPAFVQWCEEQGIPAIEIDWKKIEAEIRWAENPNCHIVTLIDANYPTHLKQISAPPPILYVQGNIAALSFPQIAQVGSRHPSVQGRENAYRFAFELCQQGFTVTSGLAIGIDGASHQGAIAAEGTTVAVLGSGLDQIYPNKHLALAQSITENGALVTEFPLGTLPRAENFPRRNRIISGLSLGVLVVEAALKSGSLITANYALDQGREVFALPGSIQNPLAKGCNQLIRQGAKCVETVAHILEELPMPTSISTYQKQGDLFIAQPWFSKEEVATSLQPILDSIDTCTSVDTIVARTGLTPEELCSMLLELELKGAIVSVPGGYSRAEGP